MADIKAFPTQVIFLVDEIQGLIRKAIDEGSPEKVRDLLMDIQDRLNAMADLAAALSEESSDDVDRT